MYAIVRTGSKQYKVEAGDFLNVEKLDGKVGDKVALEVVFVSDGGKIEADPKKAAATKVEAEIVEQFKDKKVIVFKFKKRKNYQRKVGHRQQLTRVKILCVGDEVAKEKKKPAKKTASKAATSKTTSARKTADTKAKAETKTATKAAKGTATKAKSTTAAKKPAAAKKTTTAKTAKKTEEKPSDSE